MLRDEYDVIVVGAGPAGSTAARYAAEGGARVLVLEKDRDVATPVRCAEGVSHDGVIQFIEPDSRWIAATVKRFRLIAPNGKSVIPKLDGTAYVLDRRLFDFELTKLAANAGAFVQTKAYVYDLLKNDDGTVCGVKALIKDQQVEIRSSIVIGADGVESRVGRWAGIETACSMHDLESCAQMTLTNIDIEADCYDFYFGKEVAPGGYLWMFPKGNRTANIGLGIPVEESRKKSAIQYLTEFVERTYPNAAILTQIAGGDPCAATLKNIVRNRVMLAGDAAHQVNPTSGGGIISGMIGGMLAGQVAAEAVKNKDFSLLAEYEKRWHKRLGWRHEVFYNIKEAIMKIQDQQFNTLVDAVLKLPEEKRTIGGVFRAALWNKPSILLDVAKVFLP
jgi:digeranylgeranylglycerophospholipid reductase